MKHIAIDLEFLGGQVDGAPISIGAVEFDPFAFTDPFGKEFHVNIDIQSSIENGGRLNGDTIGFWLNQEKAAINALFNPKPVTMYEALHQFRRFVLDVEFGHEPGSTIVWGNGIRSDNTILAGAYERAGIDCPFQFWQDGDVRSLVLLGRMAGFDPKSETPFAGTLHNPVDDAKHQARYLSKIIRHFVPENKM